MGKYIDITPTIKNLNAAIIKIENDILRAIQMDNKYLLNLMLSDRRAIKTTRDELCKLEHMGYDTASRAAFCECMDSYVKDCEKVERNIDNPTQCSFHLYTNAYKAVCSMIKYNTKIFVERKTIFE